MRTLNTWTLRLTIVLVLAAGAIFSLAGIYGLLWVDHTNAGVLLPVGAAILFLALADVFQSIRKRHPLQRKWGDAIFLGTCLLILLGSIAFPVKPLLQAGHLLTGLFSFGFTLTMSESFHRFWHYPTWKQLGRKIFA